jgi:hypothetical protein
MKNLLTLALALIALTVLSVSGVAQRPAEIREAKISPNIPEQARTPTIGCCECVGKTTTLNISTGQGSPIDPLWQVNGGPSYTTPPYPGWATTLGPAKWIQPVGSPTPSPNLPVGSFKYTVQFNVPKCTIPSDVRVDGTFAADNGASILLDGNPVTSCPMPYCFKAPGQPLSIAGITPGSHTLTFEVKNEGGPSGLIVNAILTRQCQK